MGSRIEEVAGDDLKAHLKEYHVLVAEVLGGVDAELTEQERRIAGLLTRLGELAERVTALESTNRLLVKEVAQLRAAGEPETKGQA